MMASSTSCKKVTTEPSAMQNRLSTESKESSYMGFDRGIDSDIEIEVAPGRPLTPANPGCRSAEMPPGGKAALADPMSASRCSSEPHLKRRMILTPKLARWESMDPPDPPESQTLLTPDIKPSIHKSDSTLKIKQTIQGKPRDTEDERHGNISLGGQQSKGLTNHKAVLDVCQSPSHQCFQNDQITMITACAGSCTTVDTNSANIHKIRHRSNKNHKKENDSMVIMLSAIYAKLLVVIGICFPLAEVISKQIPVSYYEGFYLYLYLGSIIFLLFVYVFLLRTSSPRPQSSRLSRMVNEIKSLFRVKSSLPPSDDSFAEHSSSTESLNVQIQGNIKTMDGFSYCGNFYLRLGAVVFGIGSMIYSGLEFGQFFELDASTSCYNILYGLTPTMRMAFTFVQMHFIFLNFKISINKHMAFARFGLMHMIATNLCVWLHVLVQETKHGILAFVSSNASNPAVLVAPENMLIESAGEVNTTLASEETANHSHVVQHAIREEVIYIKHECRRSNIMGELVQEASHFLFPCSIQYSLICAAILYIMWKNIGKLAALKNADNFSIKTSLSAQSHTLNQVDCAKANKGLFAGILVLVLSIISIILFFVLIGKPDHRFLAIMEARITDLVLYLMTFFAVAVALFQVRELKHNPYHDTQLDSILLIAAQSGLYIYTVFSLVGGYFTEEQNTLLVLLTSFVCLIQATLQTIFILDASRRQAHTTSQVHRKPGREMVTFLLVCNFAMWSINTLQTQRSDSNPVQLGFYGFWAWAIITHVTTPLAIYFRFHSTVCLCDIWKRTYKMKAEFL